MCSTWSYYKLSGYRKMQSSSITQIPEETTIPNTPELLRNSSPLQQDFFPLSIVCRKPRPKLKVMAAVVRTRVSYILARFLLTLNCSSESEEDSS